MGRPSPSEHHRNHDRRILVPMVMRESQVQAFRDALQLNAEEELLEHCRQFAPRLFQVAGENGIRQVVRLGLRRSRSYGFQDQPQIRFYIEMMLVLGSDFDSDPQFSWAAETLQDAFSRPHVRGLALHRDLSLYLDRVMGVRKENVKEALNRLSRMPSELPVARELGLSELREMIWKLFPQKSDDLSDKQLGEINATAIKQSGEFGFAAGGGGVLSGVMLVFGHGVTNDPLYPWIGNALRNPLIPIPEDRLQRMWGRLRVYASAANQHLT